MLLCRLIKFHTINISKDFSCYPGGRKKKDGDYSGEEFLNEILLPTMDKYKYVCIELDGTRGISSCFLEEVFSSLRKYYSLKDLKWQLTFKSKSQSLIDEIWEYIEK